MRQQHESEKAQISHNAESRESAQRITDGKQKTSVQRQVSSMQIEASSPVEKRQTRPQPNEELGAHSSTGQSPSHTKTDLTLQLVPILPGRIRSPKLEHVQLMYHFSEAMAPSNSIRLFEAHMSQRSLMERMMTSLANRPYNQHETLLDNAIRAVTVAHQGRIQHSETLVANARPFYGKALRLLNAALPNSHEGASNDLLSATVLLSVFEMISSDVSVPYIQHAGGVAALIRIRGPTMHRTGYGRNIFWLTEIHWCIKHLKPTQLAFLKNLSGANSPKRFNKTVTTVAKLDGMLGSTTALRCSMRNWSPCQLWSEMFVTSPAW